jgi:Protein of unknown function (DUF3140)
MANAKQKVSPVEPGSDEAAEVRREFGELVNMTAKQLSSWLDTDESKAVGQKDGGESVGHDSGRRIVAILGKRKDELTAGDVGHMKKVVGYIKRHRAQRPDRPRDELERSDWTASLRNWWHDPLR